MFLPRQETIRLPYFGQVWAPNPKQAAIHARIRELERQFSVAYVGVCGASRSSKSVLLVNELIDHCLRFPGYASLLARWTDDSTQTILKPLFYEIVNDHYHPSILGVPKDYRGSHITEGGWVASEQRQFFTNGSYVHLHGLKSGDDANRYARFDGLSLHGVFISQAEELPLDVFDRLKTRLSNHDYPRLFLFEMNPVMSDFYIFREFEPEKGAIPADHAFFHASVYDNAANLPPGYIESMERAYPPGHPLRHRLIEGKAGMSVKGDPMIGPNLFNTDFHIAEIDYDPTWPLILSYDAGHTHPCLTWAQMNEDGRLDVLDVLLGTEIDADQFFLQAFQRQRDVFGKVVQVTACADHASRQHHGASPKTEWDIFREHLAPWEVVPKTGLVASKAYFIEQLRQRFTRLIRAKPAIRFDARRCGYLIEAMAGGWVKREATVLRPTQDMPVDNYYGHGADTLLYIVQHFGPGIRAIEKVRDDDEGRSRPPRRRATAAGY